MTPCPLCPSGESRGVGSFGQVLSCTACLDGARAAEVVRAKKREARGGTCDACKKRPGTLLGGSNLTPTGAFKSEALCIDCSAARVTADLDRAADAFKHFNDDANREPL